MNIEDNGIDRMRAEHLEHFIALFGGRHYRAPRLLDHILEQHRDDSLVFSDKETLPVQNLCRAIGHTVNLAAK